MWLKVSHLSTNLFCSMVDCEGDKHVTMHLLLIAVNWCIGKSLQCMMEVHFTDFFSCKGGRDISPFRYPFFLSLYDTAHSIQKTWKDNILLLFQVGCCVVKVGFLILQIGIGIENLHENLFQAFIYRLSTWWLHLTLMWQILVRILLIYRPATTWMVEAAGKKTNAIDYGVCCKALLYMMRKHKMRRWRNQNKQSDSVIWS